MVKTRVDEVLDRVLMIEADPHYMEEECPAHKQREQGIMWTRFTNSPFAEPLGGLARIHEVSIKNFPSFLPPLRFYAEEAGLYPRAPIVTRVRREVVPQRQVEPPHVEVMTTTASKRNSNRNVEPRKLGTIGKAVPKHHLTVLSQKQVESYFGDAARARFFQKLKTVSTQRQHFTKDESKNFARLTQQLHAHANTLRDTRRLKERQKEGPDSGTAAIETSQDEGVGDMGGEDGGSLSSRSDDALLDDPLEFTLDADDGEPLSARDVYLHSALEGSHMPTAGELLRKNIDTCFNVAHKGVGDEYMIVLARALAHLPAVREVDVSDNRLTDVSLKEVLRAVKGLKELRSLNLGYNKMDSESSDMLRRYLSSGEATIKKLVLAKADIDDEECNAFVKSIVNNECLTSVDLSHNLIGMMEVKNTVQPDFNTGGEAIAELLISSRCFLKTLDLSWNGIRAGSAIALADSLKINDTLIYLNLEYNGLGGDGGDILGDALYHNTTLRHLNVRNNSIRPRAAYTIAMALRSTRTLEILNMLENPVGYAGGRALMGVVLDYGNEIDIKMGSCNFQVTDEKAWFNADSPAASYTLDLSVAYERSVFIDILQMVATSDALRITPIKFKPAEYSEMRDVRLELAMEVSAPGVSATITQKTIRDVFYSMTCKRDRMRREELAEALEALGLGRHPQFKYDDLIAFYDKDESGSIEVEEFSDLVWHEKKVQDETAPRRFYMREAGKTEPFEVQKSGVVTFKVTCNPVSNAAGHYTVDSQVENFTRICTDFQNASDAIMLSRSYLTLHPSQAQGIFDKMAKLTGSKVHTVVSLLLQTQDPHSARHIQEANLRRRGPDKKTVLQALGPMFGPVFGLPTGHYRLDLAKDMHRLCARRLTQLCNDEKLLRTAHRPEKMDTSLAGNRSNFRNMTFRNKLQPAGVGEQLLLDLPAMGILEFDYVSMYRNTQRVAPIENRRLLHILLHIGIMADWEILEKQALLTEVDHEKPRTLTESVRLALELSRLYRDPFPPDLRAVQAIFPPEPMDVYDNRRPSTYSDLSSTGGRRKLAAVLNLTAALVSTTRGLRNLNNVTDNLNATGQLRSGAANSDVFNSSTRNYNILSSSGGLNRSLREGSKKKVVEPAPVAPVPKQPARSSSLVSLKYIRDTITLFMRLRQDKYRLKEYVVNLRHRAKRARLKVNMDYILWSLKDLVSARWFTVRQARLIILCFPAKPRPQPETAATAPSTRPSGENDPVIRSMQSTMNSTISRGGVDAAPSARAPLSSEVVPPAAGNGTEPWWSSLPVDVVDQSPRVTMAVWLHQKIVDLHNYDQVMDLFSPEEQAHIIYRLGWLNVWSPLKADGGYQLNLERRDEVILTRLLIHLCKAEPGENLLNQQYRFSRSVPPVPAWILNATWLGEEGFGKRGYLTCFYYSGEGKRYKGCEPDMRLRLALHVVTHADPPPHLIKLYFPEWADLSPNDLDVRLKQYLLESLKHEGIGWKYDFGLQQKPLALAPPPPGLTAEVVITPPPPSAAGGGA